MKIEYWRYLEDIFDDIGFEEDEEDEDWILVWDA